jgi:chemotaxis protein methyltransferase CheR
MMSNQQFERTRRLASGLAGIELVERHRELLDRRSRRLGIRDSAGVDALLTAVEQGEPKAVQQLLRLLTTKFTGFFRHPRHFALAAEHALQAARQRGRAGLWSAGAATGEEPWSLAMALIETFQSDDPPAGILATDVEVDALEFAQRGEYGEAALSALAPERRERFFVRGSVAGRWSVSPAVRRLVEFRALNLAAADWAVEGPFDVISCRNVLMYLEARHRSAALERMALLLAPDGLLLLDPTEHPGSAAHLFTPDAGGVYSLRRSGGPAERRSLPIKKAAPSRAAAAKFNL